MHQEKHQFLTKQWYDAVRDETERLLQSLESDRATASFSMIELYENLPSTRHDGLREGFSLSITNGMLSFKVGVPSGCSADLIVRVDHETTRRSLTMKSGPELDAHYGLALADGLLTVEGSDAGSPVSLSALHDAMCDRTEPEGP